MTVWLIVGVVLFAVVPLAVAFWPRRGRAPEPAPLESNVAREAVRAAIERRAK